MKLVPLETFPNEVEALMLSQILENEGIGVVIKPLGAGYGMWGATQWIHHRVYVSEDDLTTAKEIMESVEVEDEDIEIPLS